MIEGSSERRGAWDDVRIWMEGKLCRLDEGSEMAAYAIEPRGQWIYQDRSIERGLNVATVYKVEKDSIVLTHFEGLRLDEYLIRRYLQSMGRVHVEHNLYNRTIHFERWLPKGGLRVNMSLQWGDGPKQQNFGGIFELNLLQKRVMHMEDISKLVYYNYQPNRKS